ncbi:hypothetical protein [Jiangella sp. DSM 45060]|uniref:hypothetical protein n=1 Tax=Jiangella sp. DSM 45060 TaxID=1798224 RepID=UPI00087CFFEE|nr:hypothetical protein [Jiangella sp. DSM 45060]SDS85609.1 hypothetical protein SAMN04515669_2100 [Jiangella sp. DSM 45060]
MRNRIGLLVAAILASFALTGAGQVATPSEPENQPAAHAVAVITGRSGGDLAAALPADFAAVMGYRPVAVTDPDSSVHLTDPSGGCSWLGDTTYGFGRACRSHDLGYDVLRYATLQGGELGPWARHAIDDRFAADLRARCSLVDGGAGCSSLARATTSAVGFNSWRQGYGNPGDEAVWPYLASGVLILAAAAGPSIVGWFRPRRPR